jgi:predicted ATP-grasp superfamily ATP-dependent carboligase
MSREKRRPAAVVIGNHTQGLGIVRSAGVAGWPTWVVNDHVFGLARFSRYLSGYRRLRPGTLATLDDPRSADHLATQLLSLPVEESSLLLGVNEDITRFVFSSRARLAGKFFIPDVPMDRIYDKYLFSEIVPDTARIETRLYDDRWVQTVSDPQCFVVKGRHGNAFRRLTHAKAIPLSVFLSKNPEAVFRHLRPDEIVVQRMVSTERPVLSVCSFAVSGQILAWFQYEKLRQHPNEFGTGTYLRSVAVPRIQAIAAQVLRNIAFTGISEIELIHDDSAGTYRVIEMNPRTWKSIHFATQCGANLVDSYMTFASSERQKTAGPYLCDRYWADLATDLPQMWRDRRIGRYHSGFHESSWEKTDPLPGLALWTIFPLIGLEHLWSVIVPRPVRPSPAGTTGPALEATDASAPHDKRESAYR